jgi:hypothetical protein
MSVWPSAAACQGVLRDHAVGMALGVALNFSAIGSDPGALWERGDDATDHAKVDHDGFTLPLPLQVMGWLATAAMAVTVVAMIASWLE